MCVHSQDGLYLFDFGAGGVQIGPDLHGPYANATAGNYGSTVQNCLIEGGGQFFREGAGVLAQAVVGVRIQHNTIRNMFYSGISLGK